jgi:hypothetical protein
MLLTKSYRRDDYKDPGTGRNATMHYYPTYVFKRPM